MRRRPQHSPRNDGLRRGAAIVESAVVLGVFLMILLGSLDLCLASLRANTLAEAARRLARAGIVHGNAAASVNTVWGPTTFDGTGDDDSEMAAAIRDVLVVVSPSDVTIRVSWPDGDNESGHRVEVFVSSEYRPIVASLFGADPYVLQATSTMRIEH